VIVFEEKNLLGGSLHVPANSSFVTKESNILLISRVLRYVRRRINFLNRDRE
jgi:hypothetical protein